MHRVDVGCGYCRYAAALSDFGDWFPDLNRAQMYSQRVLEHKFPGESGYTFNRASARPARHPAPASAGKTDLQSAAGAVDPIEPWDGLSDYFSHILIAHNAHIMPPAELWTATHIGFLDANARRPLPVFVESPARPGHFEFVGCYRILRFELLMHGDMALGEFFDARRAMRRQGGEGGDAPGEGSEWARVELEEVVDPIMSGDLKHKYVQRYALNILGRAKTESGTKRSVRGKERKK